jgi:formimidoylglutamate deiminase
LGLTLLPVFYAYGGVRAAPLEPRQRRFATNIESYELLRAAVDREAKYRLADFRVGAAFHSLRAASPDAVRILAGDFAGDVMHIHAAEQALEVEDVKAWLGARPVEWLLDNTPLGPTWCVVHATHMTEMETEGLAKSGAVAGLCPITEANLGDGVFNGETYFGGGGRFGFGSDSNVDISLAGELRLVEYSQRLALRKRNVFCRDGRSNGRTLFDAALDGGAGALGRLSGRIEEGAYADLLTLDLGHPALIGAAGDRILDAFVFAGGERAIADVWSAGRHIVRGGRHVRREAIEAQFRKTMAELVVSG